MKVWENTLIVLALGCAVLLLVFKFYPEWVLKSLSTWFSFLFGAIIISMVLSHNKER